MIYKKIFLTGTHGTGKTTILNDLVESQKDTEWYRVPEVTRTLKQSNPDIKVNEDGDDQTQLLIFNTYKDLFERAPEDKVLISDRCLVDVTAYTIWLHRNGLVSEMVYNQILKDFERFYKDPKNLKDSVFFYFPIHFELIKDGFRSENNNFREEVGDIFVQLIGWIKDLGATVVEMIDGTPSQRLEHILKILNT